MKQIQAANGIPTTGYVGTLTRGALNAKYCTPITPPTTPTTTPTETTPTTVVAPSYGTLSIQPYPVSNAQTTLYGGQTYDLVAAQFKATGSDITVKKVAITINHVGKDAFPWQAFTNLALYDGSTKLAEIVPSQTNAIENKFAEDYTFNISGLNWVVPNNTTKILTVKGTTVVNPVTNVSDNNEAWKVTIEGDQMVYTDTAGVNYSSAGNDIPSQNLFFSTTGAQQATATVSLATDNPKANNIIISSSASTRSEIMKFRVEVKDLNATFNSGSLAEITIGAGLSTSTAITAVELWDDTTLLASAAPSWTSATTGTVSWSNFSLPIAAGATKTLTVKVVLPSVASNFAGGDTKFIQITGTVSLSGIDANSNVVNTSGTATGEKFYPFLQAPAFALSSATLTASGSSSSTVSDMGTAKIVFNVTAQGGDVYLPTISSASGSTAIDIVATVYNGGVATSTAASSTAWTCSNVTEIGSTGTAAYRISSGATAICEVNTNFTIASANAGFYEVKITTIPWDADGTWTSGLINQTWVVDNLKTGLTYISGK
ncbi:MAG: Peptidoglycan-binding protein [Patescibacteria group bacterium]|nr:Peptidoglycan-binding protein [Patescibacteria group bacterium]